MHIRIDLDTENAAFEGAPEQETARILRHLADRLERAGGLEADEMKLRDHNGNAVGRCIIEEE